MHRDDAIRELAKIELALGAAELHLVRHNETNAALHMSETVLHSPLTIAVINARASVEKLRVHLSA
jgi:hypothetical protein